MSVLARTNLHTRESVGPISKSLGQLGSVIDVIVLGLTILGSSGVLISLLMREFKARSSTVRTRLLMFLVFSDLFMGVIGILSPTYYLVTGKSPGPDSCSAIGFLLLTSIWTQYINAIVLCVATYIILLHPLSRYVRYLQRYWMWLPPIMWGLSLIAAGVCWRVTGFTFTSGFCYIGDKGPAFFGDYYALCPRAVVFLVIVVLYGRLFHFLRRPDKLDYLGSSQSQSDEIRSRPLGTTTDVDTVGPGAHRSNGTRSSRPWWKQGSRLGRRVGIERGVHSDDLPSTFTPTDPHRNKVGESEDVQEIELRGDIASFASSTYASRKDSNSAPWEKLDLYIPETVPESRRPSCDRPEPILPRGTGSIQSDPSTLVHKPSIAVFTSTALVQHRPSVSSSEDSYACLHPIHQSTEQTYSPPSIAIASGGPSDSIPLGRPIVPQTSCRSSFSSHPPLFSPPPPSSTINPSGEPIDLLPTSSTQHPPQSTHTSQPPVFSSSFSPDRTSDRASASSSLTSLHYTISTVDSLSAPPLDLYIPSASANPARRSTVREPPATPPATELGEAELAGSHKRTEQIDDDDDDDDQDRIMDFKDMLDGSASPGAHLASGQSRENQESLSSFMNRKASLLMILFPIAYVVLFTLSLARIITDLVHPHPIPLLSGFSRWGIFASGIVDAILYGLVEWKIKRDVRRQTKKSRQEGVTSELG
ncbi:G protein-coupled receptor, rhodopsin-like [Phaffia rhodozyma]|uniref:G protein-coupled receptor, rhodopsin-like n=1 Tax=Phaffia rhodozyma TaxID=264483 RepID=A0A0F7SKV1_PHARH|nr:G protein-coupled receptor, rhodopsin-like [Phaffia rhodozyma]